MKKIFLFVFLCFVFFMSVNCFAEDYIVALKDGIDEIATSSALELLSEDEIISEKLGLILVDKDRATKLLESGRAEYIEPKA